MTRYFDPWFTGHTAHRTPDEITRCLRESIADLLAAANDPDRPRRPLTHAELEADGDTKIRGKSRGARLRERRLAPLRIYTDGGDNHGYWHGTPGVDFDV